MRVTLDHCGLLDKYDHSQLIWGCSVFGYAPGGGGFTKGQTAYLLLICNILRVPTLDPSLVPVAVPGEVGSHPTPWLRTTILALIYLIFNSF